MTKQINTRADAIFTKHWNVYNRVIEHNYMFHREFIAETAKIIMSLPAGGPLTVLDLGCGDAVLFSALLAGHDVSLYVGYDTSAEVLKYADGSLKNKTFTYRLVNDYLQHATKNETQSFSLICSSFAIHHLQDEQKMIFFKEVYDHLLADDGIFIYVDVFKNEGQPREDYIEAYINNMALNWTALNGDEFTLVEDHIRTYDFPAEKKQLKEFLRQTGFSVVEPLAADAAHTMLVLEK